MQLSNKTFMFLETAPITSFAWNGANEIALLRNDSNVVRINLSTKVKAAPQFMVLSNLSSLVYADTSNTVAALGSVSGLIGILSSGGVFSSQASGGGTAPAVAKQTQSAYRFDVNTTLFLTSSTNSIVRLVGVASSGTTLAVVGLPALTTITSIIAPSSPALGGWFIGTDGGQVYSLNSAGVATLFVTLPNTPSAGVGPTQKVVSMSCGADWSTTTQSLIVTTNLGTVYHYTIGTGAGPAVLVSTLVNSVSSNSPLGLDVSSAPNIQLTFPTLPIRVLGPNKNSGIIGVNLISGSNQIVQLGALAFTSSSGLGNYLGSVVDSTNLQIVMVFSNAIVGYEALWLATSTIPTRTQDPISVDVTSRLIRIHRNNNSQYRVESMTTGLLGETQVNTMFSGEDYLDLSLTGVPLSTEKYGVGEAES